MTCDDVRETLFLDGSLDDAGTAHVRACERCRQEEPILAALARALAAHPVPDPPPGLTARIVQLADPVLAARARAAQQPSRPHLARAVIAALLPLPVILVFHAYVAYAAHVVLSTFLPAALSAYVVFNYAALVALLAALTYGAVPVFADSQVRLRREVKWA